MYIAIEGMDRSGKSTVAKIVAERLREDYDQQVLLISEPSTDLFQGKIRELLMSYPFMDPLTETFLFLADRASVMRMVEQKPKGAWIISDRCYLSTLAYQGRAIDENKLRSMMEPWLIKPDRLYVLDVPENEIATRRSKDHRDPASMAEIVYLRDRYMRLTKEEKGERIWAGYNSCGTMPTPDAVADEIVKRLESFL